MLKKICLLFFLILSTAAIAQDEIDDPGFGEEGGGDAADTPATPINDIILPLLITGILTSIYYIRKKENQLN